MREIIRNIYRMTHIENIPHILKYGLTHRSSGNADPHYHSIGDASLIDYRSSKMVDVGGIMIALGDYIPFYFGVRMPMLYVIQHGGTYVPDVVDPQNIVYVVVSIEKLVQDENIVCYFSDGHATDSFTSFYTKQDICRLSSILDQDAIRARQWSGENIDRDLKRRKQAEFLVGNDIPASYIIGFVCYNEEAKIRLMEWNISGDKIKVVPQAYY